MDIDCDHGWTCVVAWFKQATIEAWERAWMITEEAAPRPNMLRQAGLDNQRTLIVMVALAILVFVRPRYLAGFSEFGPIVFVLFLASLHLASRSASGLRSVRVPFSIVVTLVWFMLTVAWSGSRVQSLADSFLLVCIAGTATVLASFCSLRALVGGVMAGSLAMLVVSVAIAVVSPESGLTPWAYHSGSLRGPMSDRNSLSFLLVLGLLAALTFEFRGRRARRRRAVIAASLFGGVLWTESSTCLILAVVIILLSGVLSGLSKFPPPQRRWALVGATVAITSAGLYVVGHIDELFALVDRDSTLTGRTKIWPVVQALIASRPWLGYGWGGVWGGTQLNREIERSAGFEVPHAHNGYFDVQIQVGGIGLLLLMLILAIVAVRGVAYYLSAGPSSAAWPLIMIVVLLIYNRVEASLARPLTLFLVFATLVVLAHSKKSELQLTSRFDRAGSSIATLR